MHAEAAFATASAISSLVLEPGYSCSAQDPYLYLFRRMCSMTSGVIAGDSVEVPFDSSECSQKLALKLVELAKLSPDHLEGSKSCKSKASLLQVNQSAKVLLDTMEGGGTIESMFESRTGLEFCLLGILQSTLRSPRKTSRYSPAEAVSNVLFLLDVITKFGDSIQSSNAAENYLAEFKRVEKLALAHLISAFPDENGSQLAILKSVLHVVCGVAVSSRNSLSDFDKWLTDTESMHEEPLTPSPLLQYSYDRVTRAFGLLTSHRNTGDDWFSVANTIKPMIGLLRLQLASLAGIQTNSSEYEEHIRGLPQLYDFILKPKATSSELDGLLQQASISFASRLGDFFEAAGQRLFAAQVASFNLSLATNLNLAIHSWLEAKALALQDGDTFLLETSSVEYRDKIGKDLLSMEVVSCYLRMLLSRTIDRLILGDIEKQLLSTLEELRRQEKNSLPPFQYLLCMWARSTTQLALSEHGVLCGRRANAITHLKECFQATFMMSKLVQRAKRSKKTLSPFSEERLITETISIRSFYRRIECVRRLSSMFSINGDWRRSIDYAIEARNLGGFCSFDCSPRSSLPDLLASSRSESTRNGLDVLLRQHLVRMKALSSPYDNLEAGLGLNLSICPTERVGRNEFPLQAGTSQEIAGDLAGTRITQMFRICPLLNLTLHIFLVLHLLTEGIEASESINLMRLQDGVKSRFLSLIENLQRFPFRLDGIPHDENGVDIVSPTVYFGLKLNPARLFLFAHDSRCPEESAISSCCDVLDSHFAPIECRLQAMYYLGNIELRRARRNGELAALWAGFSNIAFLSTKEEITPDTILNARRHFSTLLKAAGPVSSLLTRQALRSLALVTGPKIDGDISWSAGILIHTSIGSDYRQRVAQYGREKCLESNNFSLFHSLDLSFSDAQRSDQIEMFLESIFDHLTRDQQLTAVALCPTGELLISTISHGIITSAPAFSTVCIFPDKKEDDDYVEKAYQSIITPIDTIIQACREQLLGSPKNDGIGETAKRQWWRKRAELDEKLRELIDDVETNWFGSRIVRDMLNEGDDANESFYSTSGSICGNLASRFEAASRPQEDEMESPSKNEEVQSSAPCTILILDENLHRFPFEGMSIFDKRVICRIPSLPFIFMNARRAQSTPDPSTDMLVDPERTHYVVDPDSNLTETKNRILPFLSTLNSKYDRSWEGVVGCAPSLSFLQKSLKMRDGLLLYFGHGSGQSFLSRSALEKNFVSQDSTDGDEGVQSSIVLMGCSSGRLESINRRASKLVDQELPIYYEPEGRALSYLLAGAPCVVANLWDVTDHDIDRFAMDMLGRFFDENRSESLAECVARARSACKMRYIVGCAPVCYGLPVYRANR